MSNFFFYLKNQLVLPSNQKKKIIIIIIIIKKASKQSFKCRHMTSLKTRSLRLLTMDFKYKTLKL